MRAHFVRELLPVGDTAFGAQDLDVRRGAQDARANLLLEAVHHRHHGDERPDAERDPRDRDEGDEGDEMRAALGAGIAQADEKLEGSQEREGKRQGPRLSRKPGPLSHHAVSASSMMGFNAATTRSSCAGESIAPRICRKRSFCAPEAMYCQR